MRLLCDLLGEEYGCNNYCTILKLLACFGSQLCSCSVRQVTQEYQQFSSHYCLSCVVKFGKNFLTSFIAESLTQPSPMTLCSFLPARRCASAGLCDSNVSVRPSVCPSVCLSRAGIVSKRKKVSVMISSLSGSPTILVF